MSSILKALKKLEEDKRKAAQQNGQPDHARPHGSPQGRRTLLALLAGVVGGGILVAVVLTSGQQQPSANAPPQSRPVEPPMVAEDASRISADESAAVTAPVAVQPQNALTAPGSPPKDDEFLPVIQQPASPAVPSPIPPRSVGGPAPRSKPQTSGQTITKPAGQETLGEVRMQQADIPHPGFERTGTPPSPDLPFIVTEIYYEPGNTANMAVVNDLPAMEGTTVDGVLLRKIEADRVIFEVDGQPVAVPLTPTADSSR